MLESLRRLYALGLVPDKSQFDKLLMLVVSEVSDNTYRIGMSEYPRPLNDVSAVKTLPTEGSRSFKRGSPQYHVVTDGLNAVKNCVVKYLETGGGRFKSPASISTRPQTQRRRRPGNALQVILRDFVAFDNDMREKRHIPAASLHGVQIESNALLDGRYACGLLPRFKLSQSAGSYGFDKYKTMKSEVNKLFKNLKRVGRDLAKGITPDPDHTFERKVNRTYWAKILNCKAPDGSDGILPNLKRAENHLVSEKNSFPEAGSLILFLESAVRRLRKLATRYCDAKLGAGACKADAPEARCGRARTKRSGSSKSSGSSEGSMKRASAERARMPDATPLSSAARPETPSDRPSSRSSIPSTSSERLRRSPTENDTERIRFGSSRSGATVSSSQSELSSRRAPSVSRASASRLPRRLLPARPKLSGARRLARPASKTHTPPPPWFATALRKAPVPL